ncbi:protein-L-isoaspartate(D-aspartate) O-methyltransferase [Gammaproteobacteria bacterium]
MPNINLDHARFNMVKQQIQPWDVLDSQVLDVLGNIPREKFVPPIYRNFAFAAIEIPIGHGQATMFPVVEGRMLQTLALRPTDIVLEVGTGSGFVTALLASLAKHVYSVDIYDDFVTSAYERLTSLGITNVTLEQGDAAAGWDRHAPYDVIVLTGSMPELPDTFSRSLRPGGRMFAVVGVPPVMKACLVTRIGEDAYAREDIFETILTPLVNATGQRRFLF